MDEGEYRSTYHSINEQRCQFEKSILSRRAACCHAHRFCLADREGITCQHSQASISCKQILEKLRNKATFALQLTRIDGPLPHAKEVRVQMGGLIGLHSILNENTTAVDTIENINGLLEQAAEKYGDLDALPYNEIARFISHFEGRKRSRTGKTKQD